MTLSVDQSTATLLARDSNQALGIAEFAIGFMRRDFGEPSEAVKEKTRQFFADAAVCGLSAIALGTNAPSVLREEAAAYPHPQGATVFGSSTLVAPEKAILANCSAVREWDSNGTNFGFNPKFGHTAGEFGHNDFYAVPVAAAQMAGRDGAHALRAMILHDEIRGRLAEVFSLKSYRIDHVVHGAIASAAVYGAMMGASAEQIESAIGMTVAHFIPWRAIRAGKQLSDSKGASAAISTEVAVLSMMRSMRGFMGPRDIFRNPEAIWRQFEPTDGDSPFDLVLSHSGDDFAVMGMHFKLGLYEHQSAGALQGMIDLVSANPDLLENPDLIKTIRIVAYQPAFGIIGDPAKRDPKTRQSADHSMVYIVSTLLRKAIDAARASGTGAIADDNDAMWKHLILTPYDFDEKAMFHPETRALMEKIQFAHGGKEYDDNYPDGIPTSVVIETTDGRSLDSGLVMYPSGHARNTTCDLEDILKNKAHVLGQLALDDPDPIFARFREVDSLTSDDLKTMNDFEIRAHGRFE
ncbi:MAG: MmgE/PrpD family protein [Phycisphaerales bacterium]|nr:MmgE/PrpD family protein [Phycisphaerales bacterium]